MFLVGLLELALLVKFFGFSISWIGGLAGFLAGWVVLLRKVFWSLFDFCEGLFINFWFRWFIWDCELLTILGLLGFFGRFEFKFGLSGLFRGLINNGFLFELLSRWFVFLGGTIIDLSSLFFLEASFFIDGLFIESIFLSGSFLLIRF